MIRVIFRLVAELYGGDGWSKRRWPGGQRLGGGRAGIQVGTGVAARPHRAAVRRADDRAAAAALERQPARDARAPVHAPGGARALLAPRRRRRHALADGARLDRP